MARPKSLKPSHFCHGASGRGCVKINGRPVYTGKWGTQETQDAYDRIIGEWIAGGRGALTNRPAAAGHAAGAAAAGLTVNVVLAAFWTHAESYYKKPDGTPSTELDNLRAAVRPLRHLYGRTPAADFGPKRFKALQPEMVRLGWCRTNINRNTNRIKCIIKWAASEEVIPPGIYHGLLTVRGLPRGKGGVREKDPVRPVAEAAVDATLPVMPAAVAAMVNLQLLTGMRPGEVCAMRTGDVDRTGKVWVYRPADHKTAHHGHAREIHIGPKAQEVLTPWLKLDPTACIFSPADSERARHAQQREERATPMTPSQRERGRLAKRRNRERAPGDRYTKDSYRVAIRRACLKVWPVPAEIKEPPTTGETPEEREERLAKKRAWYAAHCWHPHQLRHTAATRLRRDYGLEVAKVILGHATLSATQVYAQRDGERAREVIGAAG